MRQTLLTGLFLGLLGLTAAADPHSGPKHDTLLTQPWGTIYCAEKSEVKPDPSGKRFTVKTPDGPVAIIVSAPWISVQAPNGSLMRVRSTELPGATEVLVQLNKTNYRIVRRFGEVEWNFPDDRIYFKTLDGNVRDVLGNKGTLSIRHNYTKKTYVVENDEGSSEYQLLTQKTGKGAKKKISYKLKVKEGAPPAKYPYLVKGVTFELGSVGFYLPLTDGKFVNALEWSQVQNYKLAVTAVPPAAKAEAAKAAAAPDDDDPMNLKLKTYRREYKAPDPLDANSAPPGTDPLKLDPANATLPRP